MIKILTFFRNKIFLALITAVIVFLPWFFFTPADTKTINILIPVIWFCIGLFCISKNYFLLFLNAYFLFFITLMAEKLNFVPPSFVQAVAYTFAGITLLLLWIFLYEITKKVRIASFFAALLSWALWLCVLVLPVSFVIYALNFHTKVSFDIIFDVLQTNPQEAQEYLSALINTQWLVFVFGALIISLLLFFLQIRGKKKSVPLALVGLLIVLMGVGAFAGKNEFSAFRFTYKWVKHYFIEFDGFLKVQAKRKLQGTLKASKAQKGETYVFVIGESLNKYHMGLYGYPRHTSPLLTKAKKEGQLIVFTNVFASSQYTNNSVPMMLTEKRYSPSVAESAQNSYGLGEVFKKANIKTWWITNQQLYDRTGNYVTVIAKTMDHIVPINHRVGVYSVGYSSHDDGDVLTPLEKILKQQSKGNRVIFLHLMGSHYNTCKRFPKSYARFSDKDVLADFGHSLAGVIKKRKGAWWSLSDVDCYDDSVLYNDYVISKVLSLLKKQKGVRGFLYFSDHGENVLGGTIRGTGGGNYNVVQVPFISWSSKEYQQKYSSKYKVFKAHRNVLFGTEDLYHTIIGLLSIKTDHYKPQYDLSSSQYNIDPNNTYSWAALPKKVMPKYMQGKHYATPHNRFYQEHKNGLQLLNSGSPIRVGALNISDIGQLDAIRYNHMRSFGVHARYKNDKFDVSQIPNKFDVLSFETLLEKSHGSDDKPQNNIGKIAFYIDNANLKDKQGILNRLSFLEQHFSLKSKVTIVLPLSSTLGTILEQSGWHVGYTIPQEVEGYLKGHNTPKLELIKQEVLDKAAAGNGPLNLVLRAKVYDSFMKSTEFSELMARPISYIIVDKGLSFADAKFQEKLTQKAYYADEKVQLILTYYNSFYE